MIDPTLPSPGRRTEAIARKLEEIGSYRLLGVIGEGGMGAVYRARQLEPIERDVAIKVTSADLTSVRRLARFQAERQTLARLNHRHIARIFDAGETPEGHPYMVMEYVPGAPVDRFCDERGLTLEERIALFCDVCQAIQYAHSQGVIHRDVKPGNVLVTDAGGRPEVRVIDFGIAKIAGEGASGQTVEGRVLGTPDYMSPEQLRNPQWVDTRSDVYSLGVLLYELLAGLRPLTNDQRRELASGKVPAHPLPRPSQRLSTAHGSEAAQAARTRGVGPDALVKRLSGELDWVVLKATEEDPDRRYSSPAELATDLQRYLDGYPVLARPPSRIYTTAKFVRRHRVETAALLALLLGLGAAAAVSTRALLAEQTARREAAAEAERANAVSRFLQEMLGAPDPRAMGRDVRVVDVLDHAVTQARETLGDQPLVRAAVLEAIGNSQRGLSSFERAGELLEEALAIREEVQGPLHPDTLAAANHVIENRAAYRGTDALRPEFVALFERASAVLPDTHPLMMTLYNNLAAVHLTLGRKQGSDELLQQGIGYALRSYDLRRELLGPRAPGTSHARNNLANGYMLVGEPARAEALFRENLAIQREIFGERNQYTLSTMDNLANALARQDRHGEALDWSRQSLEGMREALGPAHLNTLYTQISLARTLQELGRSEEARSLLEHAAELAGDDPGLELARERIDAALAESPVGNPDREAGEG